MAVITGSSLDPSDSAPVEVRGKGFWFRMGAYLVDVLVLYGLNFIAQPPLRYFTSLLFGVIEALSGRALYFATVQQMTIVSSILGIVISIAYFSLFEWLYGRTLGKVVFRMRVIRENGESCTLMQTFTRAVFRYVDGFALGLVAYLYMKPPAQQRIGDKQASTVVVSAAEEIIRERPPWWKFLLALLLFLCARSFILFAWYISLVRLR